MRLYFIFSLLLLSTCSFGQEVQLTIPELGRGKSSNLNRTYRIDSNRVAAIDNRALANSKSEHFIFSFDKSSNSYVGKPLEIESNSDSNEDWKPPGDMPLPSQFTTFNEKTFRFNFAGYQDDGSYSLSVLMTHVDPYSLSDIGDPITIVEKRPIKRYGIHRVLNNGKYFAIIQENMRFHGPIYGPDDEIEVLVFDTETLDQVYAYKVILAVKDRIATIDDLILTDDGRVLISAGLLISRDDRQRTHQFNLIKISDEGIHSEIVDFEDGDNSILTGFTRSTNQAFVYSVSVNGTKIQLNVSNASDGNNFIRSANISLDDIIALNYNSYLEGFQKKMSKSDHVNIKVHKSQVQRLINGECIGLMDIMLSPEKGSSRKNSIYGTLIFRIGNDGDIKWFNAIPYSGFINLLSSPEHHIHIYSNRSKDDFDSNGNYVEDGKIELGVEVISCEQIIDINTGEMVACRIFEAAPSAFYAKDTYQIGNGILIGFKPITGKMAVANQANNNISFGFLYF